MGEGPLHHKVSQALAELYAPGLKVGNYVDRVFALTNRLIPMVLASHGILNAERSKLDAAFDRRPAGLEDAFAAFGGLMHKYEPFRFHAAINGGRPFSARDFFSKIAFHDLDIYQEVYRPMGYVDHCFVNVDAPNHETVFVGFFRDDKIFTREEKDLLELIQPHLANARKLAFGLTAAEDLNLSPELFAPAGFTPRECDVIYWLTQGKTNEEIALILHLRADSVSRHLQTIYEKMGVDHRVAAVLHALDLAKKLQLSRLAKQGGAVALSVETRAA